MPTVPDAIKYGHRGESFFSPAPIPRKMTNNNSARPARASRTRKNGPVRIIQTAAAAADAVLADAAAADAVADMTADADALTPDTMESLPADLRAAIEQAQAQVEAARQERARRESVKRAPYVALTPDQTAWINRIGWSLPRADQSEPVSKPKAKRVNTCEGTAYLLACLASVTANGAHMADLARLWFLIGPCRTQEAPTFSQVLGFIARQSGRPVVRDGATIRLV